jgi:DNA-binding MarR family transcriptional regulator
MSKIKNAELLGNLIFEILPICQKKETELADDHGLLQAEFKCLRLFGVDDNLSNKEIAKRMNLSQGRLTRIMDGLVQKGYMKREIDKSDRRLLKLSLFRRGKMLTNKLNNAFIEIHSEILQEINASQHGSLIIAMENLNSAVEKWLQRPR